MITILIIIIIMLITILINYRLPNSYIIGLVGVVLQGLHLGRRVHVGVGVCARQAPTFIIVIIIIIITINIIITFTSITIIIFISIITLHAWIHVGVCVCVCCARVRICRSRCLYDLHATWQRRVHSRIPTSGCDVTYCLKQHSW